MKESEYIDKYVKFLRSKKTLRDNLREDLAKLELEFLEIQTTAIACGIKVKYVQKAVDDIKQQQTKNKRLEELDKSKMDNILKDFIKEENA